MPDPQTKLLRDTNDDLRHRSSAVRTSTRETWGSSSAGHVSPLRFSHPDKCDDSHREECIFLPCWDLVCG